MANFTGKLNSNEIFAALYNMIISQQVFSDNIKDKMTGLANKAKVDGTLYGDTKLYYSTDALASSEWGNDKEAANLLALHRPKAPECQAITIDKFRQISLTVDQYLSKRAWGTEGAFSDFNSVMTGWIGDTKKVYDSTTYNAFLGTAVSPIATENLTVTVDEGETKAQAIGQAIADLLDDMEVASRDYNDYGQLRSYDRGSLKVIWNTKYINMIKKIDLPVLFHKDGIIDKFEEDKLNHRFFGTINTDTKKGDGTTVRSLVEQVIGSNHYFAGDLIKSTDTAPANTSYTEDSNAICKIVEVLPPFMSGFEVGTSFFNAKSLTENRYLTWGHNTLEYLKGKPMVTVKLA